MNDLVEAVSLETVEHLKTRYLTLFGVKPKITRKADLAEAVAGWLADPAHLKAYWEKLSELEQRFIQESVFNYHGYGEIARFSVKYGRFPEKPPERDRYFYTSRKALSDGIRVFFYPDAERSARIKIPDGLQSLLAEIIDRLEPDHIKSGLLPEPLPESHTLYERERLALSELHSMLILLQNKQLKVSEKTGLASSATLNKVAGDIHEYYQESSCNEASGMELIVSYGWLRLIGNSPFAKQSKTTLVPAKKAEAEPAETLKAIWERWVNNRLHDEFRRIDNIKGQTGKSRRYFTSVVTRREMVIAALKQCPVNSWVAFADFSRFMYMTGSGLKITTAPEHLYLEQPRDAFYNADWDALEARYMRCLLVEYAATLGLIDVVMAPPGADDICLDEYLRYEEMECLSRYDGLQYFRLTPLGAYVLGLTEHYQCAESSATTETAMTIQRQGRMVFSGSPTPWEQRFLSLYADQDSETVWKLSRQKIMETLQIGGSVEELKQFLQARETQPFLPEDCEGILSQASTNLDGVKIGEEALIITCKNQEITDFIVNDKTLSKWCQRLDKRQIVIPKSKETKFRESLNAVGIGCS